MSPASTPRTHDDTGLIFGAARGLKMRYEILPKPGDAPVPWLPTQANREAATAALLVRRLASVEPDLAQRIRHMTQKRVTVQIDNSDWEFEPVMLDLDVFSTIGELHTLVKAGAIAKAVGGTLPPRFEARRSPNEDRTGPTRS